MTHILSTSATITLMLLTASGYAIATVGMKMASGGSSVAAVIIIILALGGAVFAEVVLLRGGHLSMIYLGIIVTETVMVLVYAAFIGHGLNPLQIGGAVMVLGGFALVTHYG